MRKFSLAALAVLSALSLAACNSTSTDEYNGAAEGPKGFKSAEVRFQAHPEAMTRHQADELSERTDDRHLFVFGSKAERDRFLKTGDRYSYELVVPWETFPVRASEAKKYAKVDDYGDRYAYLYAGGVRYVWGCENYDEFWDRRSA